MTGDRYGNGNIWLVPPAASRTSCAGGSTLFLMLLLVSLFAALPLRPAAADYIVQQGDVLDINVLGAPGLHRQRVPVDPGGGVALPLIGEIAAAGKSLTELRATLSAKLEEKNIVRPAEVVIEVVEYRPIYVGGDVAKPGAYKYTPGMTVRDAIALAEGYDLFHLHGRDPMVEAANARADYDSYAVEFAKEAMRSMRLKAELAGRRDLDLKNLPALQIKPEVIDEIKQFESQRLAADWEERDREKAHLTQKLKQTQEQLAAYTHEQQQDGAILEQQNGYMKRAQLLMQRGLLQNSRMEELTRAVSTAQGQVTEMQARVAQAQKDAGDVTRQLQMLDDQQRAQLLEKLQDAMAKAATARYRLEAAGQRIQYMATAQNSAADPAEPPKITIYRGANGKEQKATADEATSLNPGDNIEITAKPKKGVKQAGLSQLPAGAGR